MSSYWDKVITAKRYITYHSCNYVKYQQYKAKLLIDCKNKLGECCIWDDKRSLLCWLDRDPENRTANFWTFNPETNETTTDNLPENAGSFALCELNDNDTYLFAFEKGPMFYNISKKKTIGNRIFKFEPTLSTKPNDGRVDRFGNFVFGGMNDPLDGNNPKYLSSIYRINCQDLSYNKLILNPPNNKLCCTNSICFNLKGDIMYYAESHLQNGDGIIQKMKYSEKISDVDQLDSNKKEMIFKKFNVNNMSVPDGSCIDSQDYLWNAQPSAFGCGNVVRYDTNGNVDLIVNIHEPLPVCCCFGGRNLDTLFITTLGHVITEKMQKKYKIKQVGGLYAIKLPNIKGVKENRFKGKAKFKSKL